MFSRYLDNQSAILISIIDIYTELGYASPLFLKAGKMATKMLIDGIRETSVEDKIEFCSLAISALTQNIVDKVNSDNSIRKSKRMVLDRDELDFISSLSRV